MKLQNLTVIFVIIMIPIILVTSYYIQLQIDTVTMQTDYKTKLIKAAKDSIEAFEINSVQWNSEYSSTTDSKRRNINASVNTFITSFANALGIGGTSKEYMINYIPAILYTMYDGYYIYSLAQEESGNYTHLLQPFVPYTELLTSGNDWIVINYTLDNYIEIYGEISGNYINRQGYLISNFEEIENGEELSETLAINNDPYEPNFVNYEYVYDEENVKIYYDGSRTEGNKFFMYRDGKQTYLDSLSSPRYKKIIANDGTVYYQVLDNDGKVYKSNKIEGASEEISVQCDLQTDYSAKNYYNDNNKITSFTVWFNLTIANKNWKSETLSTSTETINVNADTIFKIGSNNNPDPELINYEDSDFTKHKKDVIQKSIEENLDNAMLSLTARGSVSYDFRLPELKATDWEQLFSNVSVIAFVQGLPIGNKYFNNYAIVTSTKNNEYVDPNEIYFSSISINDEYYHKYGTVNEETNPVSGEKTYTRVFGCNSMTADASTYIGYKGTDFVIKSQDWKDTSNNTNTIYYYSHYDNRNMNGSALACYDCLVDRQKYTPIDGDTSVYKKTYYTALARERYVSHEFRD